jgi:peptidoglycan/xylan/chitin deacetylase (PgdA/CDA1 family)
MVGAAAQRHPEIVRRVAEAGHAIGNHSYNHPSFPLITRRERWEQTRGCANAIAPYGQRIFRPPYAEQSIASHLDVVCLGYKVIMFNCEVGDWWDPDASRMADLLLRKSQSGNVIVLHDALFAGRDFKLEPILDRQPHDNLESMLTAVQMFFERVGNRFRFVTIPELLRLGRPQRQNWYRTTPDD